VGSRGEVPDNDLGKELEVGGNNWDIWEVGIEEEIVSAYVLP
jgi:hypothetical protein